MTICSQIPTRRPCRRRSRKCPRCEQLVATSYRSKRVQVPKPRGAASLPREPIVKQSCITMVPMIFAACTCVCAHVCCGFCSTSDKLPQGLYCVSVKPQRPSGWWVGRVNGWHVAGGNVLVRFISYPPAPHPTLFRPPPPPSRLIPKMEPEYGVLVREPQYCVRSFTLLFYY